MLIRQTTINEREKIDKYEDIARELRKLWNLWVTVNLFLFGALGTGLRRVEKGLEALKIREENKTIQITAWLRFTRIMK